MDNRAHRHIAVADVRMPVDLGIHRYCIPDYTACRKETALAIVTGGNTWIGGRMCDYLTLSTMFTAHLEVRLRLERPELLRGIGAKYLVCVVLVTRADPLDELIAADHY